MQHWRNDSNDIMFVYISWSHAIIAIVVAEINHGFEEQLVMMEFLVTTGEQMLERMSPAYRDRLQKRSSSLKQGLERP
ncbi:hypothetical protein QYM36_010683 [Artemia franciscana]|uniref:Uncharacterized protein n=1 Tax=Artemia franciscana TaxID=6661 RepID=A0AA88L265_ARTSF|nr:hypothetical protein QYM36_010683 [Artemia franciscana]